MYDFLLVISSIFLIFVVLALIGKMVDKNKSSFNSKTHPHDQSEIKSDVHQNSESDLAKTSIHTDLDKDILNNEREDKSAGISDLEKLRKKEIEKVEFTINDNGSLKSIINYLKRNDYFYSKYEDMTNKEILEDGLYDIKYYELSGESVPVVMLYQDNNSNHKVLVMVGTNDDDLKLIGVVPEHLVKKIQLLSVHPYGIENEIQGGKYKEADMDDYGYDKVYVRSSNYSLRIKLTFFADEAKDLINSSDNLRASVIYSSDVPAEANISDIKVTDQLEKANIQKSSARYIKARKLTNSFTVIDFETTGLNPDNNEIIQIGAIKYSDGKVIDTFSSYVKPMIEQLPSIITRITGITDDMLSDSPMIQDVLPDFIEYIKNQTLVAHNASFDMKFLLSACDKCNLEIGRLRVIDTLSLSRRLIDGVTNYKLETLKKELALGEHKSHDALGDCYTTGSLYMNCYQQAQ